MEHNGRMRLAMRALNFARYLVRLAAYRDESHHAHAMLAALHRAALSLPSIERENILARENVGFGNPLGHEALIDRRIVREALSRGRAVQCFRLHFGLCHD